MKCSYVRGDGRYNYDESDPCLAANVRLKKQYLFGISRIKFFLLISVLALLLFGVALFLFLYFGHFFGGDTEATSTPVTENPSASTHPVSTSEPAQSKEESSSLAEGSTAPVFEGLVQTKSSSSIAPPVSSSKTSPTTSPAVMDLSSSTVSPTTTIRTNEMSPPSAPSVFSEATAMISPKPTHPKPIKPADPSPVKPADPTPAKLTDLTLAKPADPTLAKPTDPTHAKLSKYLIKVKEKSLMPIERRLSDVNDAMVENFLMDGRQKYDYITTVEIKQDCEQYRRMGYNQSGVYKLQLPNSGDEFFALCLMGSNNSTAWTTLQRRTGPEEEFWNRTFDEYAGGFGDAARDHWLGLERVSAMGSRGDFRLRILLYGDLCSVPSDGSSASKKKLDLVCSGLDDGFWWGDWHFSIAERKDKYRLQSAEYLLGNLSSHGHDKFGKENRGMRFTTWDNDNDLREQGNCAVIGEKGAWWHKACTSVSLNGRYFSEGSRSKGQSWHRESAENGGRFYNIKPKKSLMMLQYL